MYKKHIYLAGLSLLLLVAGIYPPQLMWISLFGFIPLFLIVLDVACRTRFVVILTAATGFLYYGAFLYWLVYFDWKIYGIVLLCVGVIWSVYFLLARLLISRLKSDVLILLTVTFLWLFTYRIFKLTPLGPTLLEVPFYGPLPLMRVIHIVGLTGYTSVIVLITIASALLIQKRTLGRILWVLCAILIFGGLVMKTNLHETGVSAREPIKVALIQHNLPMSGKWRFEHPEEIKARYRELAFEAAKKNPDLVIFPLYSLPEDPLRKPAFFESLAKEIDSYILVGSHIPMVEGKDMLEVGYFTVALLYSPEGKLVDYYQATEKPPLRDRLEHTANEYKVLDTPLGKLGVLLCYEDIDPYIIEEAVKKGVDILIAVSNPGHFTKTHVPFYHLMQDQLRAIESGKPVVRVSSNGYSALIDSHGRILTMSDLDEKKTLYSV